MVVGLEAATCVSQDSRSFTMDLSSKDDHARLAIAKDGTSSKLADVDAHSSRPVLLA
jgi:hypothetical protein